MKKIKSPALVANSGRCSLIALIITVITLSTNAWAQGTLATDASVEPDAAAPVVPLPGPVPDELIVENGGLKWVWASPCNGGCSDPDPAYQDGWRNPTDDELLSAPSCDDFRRPDNSIRCASAYFDPIWDHCDLDDCQRGFVSGGANWDPPYQRCINGSRNGNCESWFVMDVFEKELTSGPDRDGDGEIDLAVPINVETPTQYDFTITWGGGDSVWIYDQVPAEWNVTHIQYDDTGLPLGCGGESDFDGNYGMVEIWRGGKPGKNCNSDTGFRWMPTDAAGGVCVSQEENAGAGDFVLLGAIQPFDRSGESAAAVYSYGNPAAASYNGFPPSISDTSQLFLVNTNDGAGPSLFVVHDTPNDGAGGTADMTIDVAGDTAGVLVLDDPGEPVVDVGGFGTQFVSDHAWVECCTDGLVLGTLEGPWQVDAQFDAQTGMTAWQATSSDGTSVPLALDLDRRVRLSDCGSLNVQTEARCHDNRNNNFCRPTSCGALYLNYGAVAFLKDPDTGEVVLDDNGDPIVVDGPTDPICLAAVDDVNGDGEFAWDGSGDEDGDGISDYEEACGSCPTDPCSPSDRDGDGVADPCDNCPDDPNPDQSDRDGDGIGDVCDECPDDPLNECLACGEDWTCGAEIPVCGTGGLDICVCDLDTAGADFCWENFSCGNPDAVACSTNADCTAGWACVTSCCGQTCAPPCSNPGAPDADFTPAPAGPGEATATGN